MSRADSTPIGAMKILSCYREVKQILDGGMPVPRTLEFFLSNACNHACGGCHSRHLHRLKHKFIDFEKLKEIVSDFAELGGEGIEISGGGEPLLYPQLIPAVAFMRSKGLKVGIFSNGTLLDRKLSKFLMENLLFLRVAFDAATRETYRKMHGRDEFEKLKKNMKQLMKFRKDGGATVGAKFLVSTWNWQELHDAAVLAGDLGLDYFQFKTLRDSRFTPKGAVLKKAMAEAERARELTNGNYQVFGSLEKTKPAGRCFLNPLHPVIDATGAMYLCAFFHHRKQSHKIGSVYEKSLPEIWYSERHFKAFKTTKPKECAVFDCPFHEAGALAKEWIVENRKHLEFI